MIKPFGLYSLTVTDAAGENPERLPVGIMLRFSPRISFAEFSAEGIAVGAMARIGGIDWEIDAGGISLDAWSLMTGRTVSATGEAGDQVWTLDASAGELFPYFRIYGQAYGDSGNDIYCKIYRAKLSHLEGTFRFGQFWITSAAGSAYPAAESPAFEFVEYETAADEPGGPPVDPPPEDPTYGDLMFQFVAGASKLFSDTNGTTPATPAGEVWNWAATYPDGAGVAAKAFNFWPAYYEQIAGGTVDVVRFSGSKLTISGAADNDETSGPKTYFWVVAPTSTGSGFGELTGHGNTSHTIGIVTVTDVAYYGTPPGASVAIRLQMGVDNWAEWGPFDETSDLQILAIQIAGNGQTDIANARAWLNGAELTMAGSNTAGTVSAWTDHIIAGYRGSTAQIAELLVYDNAISDTDIADNFAYLANKYGIELS